MKISVVVPTHKRPDMLRSALLSIQEQSRPDLVAEVLVSENSEDGRSEDVCRSFPGLPIRFYRQVPAKSLTAHFQWLVETAASDWVAWLADDDMWGRYHLEEAARLIGRHPEALAFAGECVTIYNDSRTPVLGLRETAYSLLGNTRTEYKSSWLWTREDMFTNLLLHTPLNMWAMVFRKPALLQAIQALVPSDAGYESDRLFLWSLAQQGPVVVGREITLFYRTHEHNTWATLWRQDKDKQQRLTRQYISDIIDQAEGLGMPARQLWLNVWNSLEDTTKQRLLKQSGKPSTGELRRRWGDEAVSVTTAEPATPRWRKALQLCLPPVLWSLAGRVRRVLSAAKQ